VSDKDSPLRQRRTAARPLRSAVAASLAGALLATAHASRAATINDPSGDFLASYVGPAGGDLDIVRFTAEIHGNDLLVNVRLNGRPGVTASAKYNIAVDRGAGTNAFPPGFRPGASLDAAVNVVPRTLTGEVRLFEKGVVVSRTPLPSGAVAISGNGFSVVVPLCMLPTTGFAPREYTFLLWSRTQLAAGVPAQFGIADFAPGQGALAVRSRRSARRVESVLPAGHDLRRAAVGKGARCVATVPDVGAQHG
jgi:hypothetical protein